MRLVAQRLIDREPTTPQAVARHLLAAQAQDYSGAKWSLALRAPGTTEADVEAALRAGEIVRSWPLRGTLHLTAADDLPWLLDTLAPRTVAATSRRRLDLGLTEAQLGKAAAIAEEALSGGRALIREDLLARFDARKLSTEGQRGYHILAYLGLTGTLCFGPTDGKQHTFVRLADWIPRPRRRQRDEALGELTTRYFTSHGPASVADLCGWAGITVKDAQTGLALAGKRLVERAHGGVACWLGADVEDRLASVAKEASASVLALAGFDEYVLGYKDRDAFLDPAHANAICPGGNGFFQPTLVRGGQIVGTWRRAPKGKTIVTELTTFAPSARAVEAGFARAMQAYGAYLGQAPPSRSQTSAKSSASEARPKPKRTQSSK